MDSPRNTDVSIYNIGTHHNSRWYRNRLHENDEIEHENNVSNITTSSVTNQKSVVSYEIQNVQL